LDNVDIVDKVPPAAPSRPHTVNIVNNVIVTESENEAASDAVYEATERAAIQAEAMPARRHRKRPVSWARPDDEPMPGDYCGCCALDSCSGVKLPRRAAGAAHNATRLVTYRPGNSGWWRHYDIIAALLTDLLFAILNDRSSTK
jgi:hypothetical protein